jgi:hypothetical protein
MRTGVGAPLGRDIAASAFDDDGSATGGGTADYGERG